MTRRRLTLSLRSAVIGGLVLALVGAALHASLTHPTPASVTETRRVAPATSSGPTVEHDGLLAGFAHTRSGALSAATTYVREGQRVFDLPPAGRAAALRSIAASAAADGFINDQAAQLAELDGAAQRGSGPLTWLVAVLATRVNAYSPEQASVSLWRVGILSVGGMTTPLAEWTTVDYELVWQADDWRIWSETQVPGPTPLGDPNQTLSSPTQWRNALAGFVRFPGTDPL
jgi:hypothetical protein